MATGADDVKHLFHICSLDGSATTLTPRGGGDSVSVLQWSTYNILRLNLNSTT